ncbi:hypothetical protein [Alcanivorax sp. 1008]|uniref:hypothetical protein n=1 Tax=Alcanivorax sp. 1008 TaxID=2816853 RepID=UPI001D7C2A35|nr:hypothetical protein [Alcanivorax sp. 1008]MCC1495666.1 hypothetical protein [Alcanivorax sp. 1008]
MKHRSKRGPLNVNVRVREPGAAEPFGHIIDLSIRGLSVSGQGQPLSGDARIVELQLPWTMHGTDVIVLEVDQRWLDFTDTGRWHAGYQIVSCPEEALLALEHLSASFADH